MAFTTRKNMLQAMQHNDNSAWEDFLTYYGPLIKLRADDFRLTPQETDELRQDICVSIFSQGSLETYDPQRARFRDYLRGIIAHRALDILRRRPDPQQRPLKEEEISADDDLRFEQEWREFLLGKAVENVKSRCDDLTFMAFQLHSWQGRPAKEVAKELEIPESKVFLASSRIKQRLAEEVKRLEKEWDE
jgi:RNA polymerase sigma factor (sigma-70 family)